MQHFPSIFDTYFFYIQGILFNKVYMRVIYSMYKATKWNIMGKQKLSAAAAKRKAARDLRYANSEDRKAKRRDSQMQKRKAKKKGISTKGKDFDHKTRTWKSVKSNRGNGGKGTKKESGARYKVPAKKK